MKTYPINKTVNLIDNEDGTWTVDINGDKKPVEEVLADSIYEKIWENIRNTMKSNTPKKEEWVDGGYNAMKESAQEATYEDVGYQRKVKRKPGRRIKNRVAELMEGGKIRAGNKIMKNGKLLPNANEFFTITTMRRMKDINPDDPDTGFERDEAIQRG
jgi:hypothetical protein